MYIFVYIANCNFVLNSVQYNYKVKQDQIPKPQQEDTTMSKNDLHSVIKELKEYKLLKEEAEARITELENVVKAEMKSQNLDKMGVGEYKCSLSTITSNRVDSKALQENRPDIFNLFIKQSTFERLTIR